MEAGSVLISFWGGDKPRFRIDQQRPKLYWNRADAFLKHYSPRIVYSVDLAKNTKDYLMGYTNAVDYGFNPDCEEDIAHGTQALIDYWYKPLADEAINNGGYCSATERL